MKRFKEVTNSVLTRGMAAVICPDCKNAFGLSNSYLERMGEINVHFSCPYCGNQHGLQKLD